MTLRELIEKRNRLLAETRQIMSIPDLSTEQRTKVDAMLADANALKADIERFEACAESEERSLPSNRPPREGFADAEGEDNRTQEQRLRDTNVAFRAFMKNERFEQRDLTVAADGGVMIPVGAMPPLVAQRSAGSIYDVVGHVRTSTGEPIRFPLWDDTSNGVVLDSTAIGNGTDPTITGVTISVDGLRTGDPLLIDNKLIADLSYDVVSYAVNALTQRQQRAIAQSINIGNSSNFVGLKGNLPFITSETVAVLGYDDFVNIQGALDPGYHDGAVFAFSNTVLSTVLKIKDTEGRPIFLPYLDGAKSGFAGQTFGFPVKINPFGDSVATGNTPVMFGDFSKGYQLREVTPGLVIKQSNQRWIELNRLGLLGFYRAGGAPTLANATTYSPIQALKIG